MRIYRFTFLALSLAALTAAQQGTRRIEPVAPAKTARQGARKALMIGNQKYRRDPLRNTINDVTDLARVLINRPRLCR